MNKYVTFMRIGMKDALFYRMKIVSSLFVWCLRAVIVCVLYSYAYSYVGTSEIRGISREVALWSLAMYFVFLALYFRTIFSDISKSVKHGDVEVHLNKPYSYPIYLILLRLAKSFPEFILTTIGIGTFLYFYAPLQNFVITPEWIIAVTLLFIGGLIMGSCFYFLIGLSAFWLEEADPVYWLCDKLVMVLAGSYVPVAFFPPLLKALSDYSPFGSMIFVDRIFYPDFLAEWGRLVFIQWSWVVVIGVAMVMAYRYVRRQVFISGG